MATKGITHTLAHSLTGVRPAYKIDHLHNKLLPSTPTALLKLSHPMEGTSRSAVSFKAPERNSPPACKEVQL